MLDSAAPADEEQGMTAGAYDLLIEQGVTFRFTTFYGYKDGTQDVAGNDIVIPYDITGCVIRLQIRQRRGSPVLVSATTTNGGISIDDALQGKFTVTLTDEVTDTLTMSKAKYDCEIGFPSGDVRRVYAGDVKISPAITQGADLDNISDGLVPVYDRGQQQVDVDTLVTNQPSTAGQ